MEYFIPILLGLTGLQTGLLTPLLLERKPLEQINHSNMPQNLIFTDFFNNIHKKKLFIQEGRGK